MLIIILLYYRAKTKQMTKILEQHEYEDGVVLQHVIEAAIVVIGTEEIVDGEVWLTLRDELIAFSLN